MNWRNVLENSLFTSTFLLLSATECILTKSYLFRSLIHIERPFLYVAPFFDRTALGDGFDEECLIQCANYIVQCINELVILVDNYHQPKFRILIRRYFSKLAKFSIYPKSFALIAEVLLMTMTDVMQDEFTEKVECHWMSVLIVIFRLSYEAAPCVR